MCPIYDIKCQDKECDEITEVVCKYEDVDLNLCPKCGGPCKQKLGGSDFRLKGAGWQGLEISNMKNWYGGNKRYEKD